LALKHKKKLGEGRDSKLLSRARVNLSKERNHTMTRDLQKEEKEKKWKKGRNRLEVIDQGTHCQKRKRICHFKEEEPSF